MSGFSSQISMKTPYYQQNPKLKRANVIQNLTPHEKREIKRCKADINYFCENYLKVVHVDHGLVPLKLYPYQADMVNKIANNRYFLGKLPRQCGKCFSKSTRINIRNKYNGEISNISIGEFYELCKKRQKS